MTTTLQGTFTTLGNKIIVTCDFRVYERKKNIVTREFDRKELDRVFYSFVHSCAA